MDIYTKYNINLVKLDHALLKCKLNVYLFEYTKSTLDIKLKDNLTTGVNK